MVIVGGTNALAGCGKTGIVGDAWVLRHFKSSDSCSNKVASWLKLPWEGSGVVRCRHTMSITGSFGVVIWGGYDGDTVVNDEVKVWHASLHGHVGPVEELQQMAKQKTT